MDTQASNNPDPAAVNGSQAHEPARSRPRLRRPSAWTLVVFLVLAVPTVSGAAVARRGIQRESDRILSERTAEAVALLSSTMLTSNASLTIIGTLAASQDLRAFERSAGLLARGGSVVGTVVDRDGELVVVAAVGGPAAGDQLTGEREAVARRALASRRLAATVIDDPSGPRTLIAVPVPGTAPMVTYHEGLLSADRHIPPTANSPFRELRGAVYAAPTADPAKLVLTTESDLPLSGRTQEVQFDVGADSWTIVVAARGSLVGEFAESAPWILLAVGLLAAALAAAAMELQVRRRAFAQATVEARTTELEDTRHFLERLFASGPTAVLRLNTASKESPVVYVSPNTVRVLGVDLGQVISSGSLEEWIHPDDVDLVRATSSRLADAALESESIEFRLRQPDGSYRWVSALWMLDQGESGPRRRVVVYLNDITERRESEEAIRMAQQASDTANRSKSEFLSRMSHELRTPLNSVLGFGQLLEIGNLSDEQRESVQQIMKAGKHLLVLINEVLDITRIESGRLLLSPEAVPVEDLVRETLDLIRPIADQREIQLVAHWDGMADRYVFADHQRTKQVLLNLLSNAVKYNRPRGTVAVSCTAHDTRLRISVADTGPGIRADQLDKAFSPFERLEAAQSDVEGTGIGLTLSRYLTQAMGGTLDAESTIGRGSTFSFELPAAEGPVNRYERLGSGNGASIPAAPAAPRRKVLCIEDNPSNLTLVKKVLALRPEVEVVSAMQGGLGVELASELQPALVLLDLHLPDVAGEQILHRLRDDPATASIPVAILSADATAGQSQRMLAAGALAYMSKPLDVVELLKLVDSAVARH